ncbi:MAG TPA: hypothetical protein PK400_11650, partial [Phycisphaerales bacterium]|nr:hypothetical protein [Phycisphaerales bacterium]
TAKTDDVTIATHLSASSLTLSSSRDGSARMTVESCEVSAVSALDRLNAAMQSDAPACDTCGSITVRNGTCYKCMNCGASMGCS